MGPERAFVLLDGFVNQQMSFEFVLSIEGCFAHTTFEWSFLTVDEHVHFQVTLGFESFVADIANV